MGDFASYALLLLLLLLCRPGEGGVKWYTKTGC